LPHLPINTVLPLLSAAAPADLTGDHPDDSSRDVEAAQKLDDQTFALLKSLQLQGASGLALELIHYILARCLRKYGDFLRNRGHLQLARDALLIRLSETLPGSI
jgi:hypothetical protein